MIHVTYLVKYSMSKFISYEEYLFIFNNKFATFNNFPMREEFCLKSVLVQTLPKKGASIYISILFLSVVFKQMQEYLNSDSLEDIEKHK